MPENIFEKIIYSANADRQQKLAESKKAATSAKKVVEAKKPETKEVKKVTESKPVVAKKPATKKAEELKKVYKAEDYDPDLDPSPEIDPDYEGGEYDPDLDPEAPDVDMPGTTDEVVVVVDPEKSEDEVTDAAQDIQEEIDGTPEGEEPFTDEYVGDDLYQCPICGQTFVSDVALADGDECPVCGQTPNGFLKAGSIEEAPEDDEPAEEAPEEDEGAEDLDLDVPKEDEEDKKESKKPTVKRVSYAIDENTFNPILTKFISENYKNAKSFVLVGATQKKGTLTLECKLTMKSGKSKSVNLKVENYKLGKTMRWYAKDDGSFKVESKGSIPFVFKTTLNKGNVIKCEGMRYNYVTKMSEGKTAQIYGSVLNESKTPLKAPAKKPVVAPKAKVETKTASVKRPVSSGVKKN